MEATVTTYTLVNHKAPDFDSAVTTLHWLYVNGLGIDSPNVRYEFVAHDKRYHRAETPNEEIIHIDVGKLLDRKNIDHHMEGSRWPSAARAMTEIYPELLRDPLYLEVINLTDRVDSGSEANAEPNDLRLRKLEENDLLKTWNFGRANQIMVIAEQVGPRHVVDFISNIGYENDEIDDKDKLIAGMILLDEWYKRERLLRYERTVALDYAISAEQLDRLCGLYLELTAKGEWLCNVAPEELVRRFNALTADEGKSVAETVLAQNADKLTHYHHQGIAGFAGLYRRTGALAEDTTETIAKKVEIAERLTEFNSGREEKLIPITLCRGPWEVLTLFPGNGRPLEVKLALGLSIIRAWWNRKTMKSRMRELVDSVNCVEVNGIRFLPIKPTTFMRKQVRTHIRQHHRNDIDVTVATYVYPKTGKVELGITRIAPIVNGMDELKAALQELDPTAHVFLHQKKFVIYITIVDEHGKQCSTLTADQVFRAATKFIHKTETPRPVEDEDDEE